VRILGFMSGTSLDGVDAAIIDTDGEMISAFGPAELLPFTAQERALLVEETESAVQADLEGQMPAPSEEAQAVVLSAHIRAAQMVIAQQEGTVDLVGFHGQTVLHRPEDRLSIQLGDPAELAVALGIPVVAHMRQADLDAGGQGAPLVPAYHAALAAMVDIPCPVAFVNVGGVANITWLGVDGGCIAFDTGPGNGMIDLMVQSRGAARYDDGGRWAAAGQVDEGALARLLEADYFKRQGPKSLDRYDFSLAAVEGLSIEDAAATLTAFTAEALRIAAHQLPEMPKLWLICGGGRHNPTLMQTLRDRLGDCRSIDEYGFRGDFVEAEAMAFLAARSVRGLPLTFPDTTGVEKPTTGGQKFLPKTSKAA
jgi:anhydro-N-acetylmuramic acid kinase